MTTKTKEEVYKEEFEKWNNGDQSEDYAGGSHIIFNFGLESYKAGRRASEAENQNLKRENGILRRSLNKLHSDVSMGEHLDSEWIINTIEQEVTHPVIDASLKMLKVREQTIQRQEKIIELLKQSNEFYASEVYASDADNSPNYHDCLPFEDMENFDGYVMGGKLARSIKQQLEDLEDKQGEA